MSGCLDPLVGETLLMLPGYWYLWHSNVWLARGVEMLAVAMVLFTALLSVRFLPKASMRSRPVPLKSGKQALTNSGTAEDVAQATSFVPLPQYYPRHPKWKRGNDLQSVTQALSEASTFHSGLGVALRQLCETTPWEYGAAWLPQNDPSVLECSSVGYSTSQRLTQFQQDSEKLTFSPNCGLPGRVWLSGQPEWVADLTQVGADCPLIQLAQVAGLKTGAAIPIKTGEQVQAVLTFFSTQSLPIDSSWMELMTLVAMQLGLVLQRKQLEEELHKTEERYLALADEQVKLVCRFNADGTLTFVNDAYCRYFGKTHAELLGCNIFQIMPDEYREKTQRQISDLNVKNPVATREHPMTMPNGNVHWLRWTDKVINQENSSYFSSNKAEVTVQSVEYQSVGQDITKRRLSEQESARLASIPLLSPNPIVETDLAGNLQYLNPEAMRVLPELLDTHGEHPFIDGVRSLIPTLQHGQSLRREVKIGEVYYEQVLHYLAEIECLRIYAFDITERKKAEEQLIYNAFYDQLTGLANRALFMDRLKQATQRAQEYRKANSRGQPHQFAVLFVNLNRFKVVNDSLGSHSGDHLLQAFAQRLLASVHSTDTVARVGGDEFTILLQDIQDISDTIRIAEAIHQSLISPFYLDESEVFMTVSIGIALNTISDDRSSIVQAEDLLRNAGIAMYRARSEGKAIYEVFDPTMLKPALDKLQMEIDLRRAIERQEFRIHYQPIVSLTTGKINGFEALVRWQHPQRGLVSPSEFIPLAEETGLITPIGWWTLQEACRQLSIWQKQFPAAQALSINVNLSCKQFIQPDLLEQIDTILEETQLAIGSLKLEITESVVMDNPDLVKNVLLDLKQRNINLCIDDFGTGYSSLSRLHHFPISTLKIDRSFVSRIGALGENSEIVQAIVTLAQTLSMDVVAEGIELSEQVDPLIALQCQYGQGYFFSKPLDSEAAGELLLNQWRQRGMYTRKKG